jgi:hypothetical protein
VQDWLSRRWAASAPPAPPQRRAACAADMTGNVCNDPGAPSTSFLCVCGHAGYTGTGTQSCVAVGNGGNAGGGSGGSGGVGGTSGGGAGGAIGGGGTGGAIGGGGAGGAIGWRRRGARPVHPGGAGGASGAGGATGGGGASGGRGAPLADRAAPRERRAAPVIPDARANLRSRRQGAGGRDPDRWRHP